MFKDANDPAMPIVIYVPRIVDQNLIREKRAHPGIQENILRIENFNVEECIKSGHCATFNFKNSEAQARTMTSLGMVNMMAAKDLFTQAVAIKTGVAQQATSTPAPATQSGILPIRVESVTLPIR